MYISTESATMLLSHLPSASLMKRVILDLRSDYGLTPRRAKMAILNQSKVGELWGETKSGGVIHLGTYHLDINVFRESDQDGIQGDEHDIEGITDGGCITVKGTWKLYKNDFELFRIRWLNAKFPSIDWYGGRELSSLPDSFTLGPNQTGDGSRHLG